MQACVGQRPNASRDVPLGQKASGGGTMSGRIAPETQPPPGVTPERGQQRPLPSRTLPARQTLAFAATA